MPNYPLIIEWLKFSRLLLFSCYVKNSTICFKQLKDKRLTLKQHFYVLFTFSLFLALFLYLWININPLFADIVILLEGWVGLGIRKIMALGEGLGKFSVTKNLWCGNIRVHIICHSLVLAIVNIVLASHVCVFLLVLPTALNFLDTQKNPPSVAQKKNHEIQKKGFMRKSLKRCSIIK